MAEANIPGMAVEVTCGTKPCFSRAYGYADIEKKIPARVDTLWLLASISKAVTSTAVMQVVEQGKLSLDTDINQYLLFLVRNPAHPDVPITLRMLMTHRSTILDNMDLLVSLVVEGDSPIQLGTFLKGYLVTGGEYYEKQNFSDSAPGDKPEYSNVGSSLAAFIVECVSGVPFDEYSTRYTLEPLRMKESGWHLKDVEGLSVATPYRYDAALRKNIPVPQSGWPDYPDSELRTSAPQLSRFLMAYVNGGTLNGSRILEPATVKEMLRIQDPEKDEFQGLIWYYEKDGSENRIFGHAGGDTGVRTQMFARAEDGVGVVILTNADFENKEAGEAIKEIRNKLFSVAGELCR